MRQPRIGGAHGRNQRINHLALDPVRQVAVVGDVGEAAPAVGDFLVLGERIGDERELLHVVREGRRERLRGGLALCSGTVLQQVQRRLNGQRFARNLETQRRDRRIELPVPGRIGRHRFLVKKLLDAILELIAPVTAHVLEPGPIVAERGISHRRFDERVVDTVEFEREEQDMRRGRRHALLYVTIKLGARRIDRIAGMHETRIGPDTPEEIVERLIAPHRRRQRSAGLRRGRHIGKFALVSLLEGGAVRIRAIEITPDRRIVEAAIEVVEIPLGQRAECRFHGRRAALSRPLGNDFLARFSWIFYGNGACA